jgi:hypothetical protein
MSKPITRSDFMSFFRDDEQLNTLSTDERIELFRYALIGSSDFTKELLDEVLSDYSVTGVKVVEI